MLIAQLPDFVLIFRVQLKASCLSFPIFLFCFSGARRQAFNTHMMEEKQTIVPHPAARKHGVVSVLAERVGFAQWPHVHYFCSRHTEDHCLTEGGPKKYRFLSVRRAFT